jgi:hypothetical protein
MNPFYIFIPSKLLEAILYVIKKNQLISITSYEQSYHILNWPNPNYGSAKYKFNLTENVFLDMKIFRINGTKYCDLYSGYLYSGENVIDINIKESGNFIISMQLPNQTVNTKFTVY